MTSLFEHRFAIKRITKSKLNDTDNQTLYYIMVQIW